MLEVSTMIGRNFGRMLSACALALLFLLPALRAHATIYSWRTEAGVLTLSNDPDDVPEHQRASVRTFTAKPAPKRPEGAATPPTMEVDAPPVDAYERGYEQGLLTAERQAALAERLAALAAASQPLPAPIIIEQPAPAPMSYGVPPYDAMPFYGFGPYVPFPFGYPIVVSRAFVPHARFFPPGPRPPFGPSFPHAHGHFGFSRTAAGWMR